MYYLLLAENTMVLSRAKRNVVDSIEPYAVAHWATFSQVHVMIHVVNVPSIREVDEENVLLGHSN